MKNQFKINNEYVSNSIDKIQILSLNINKLLYSIDTSFSTLANKVVERSNSLEAAAKSINLKFDNQDDPRGTSGNGWDGGGKPLNDKNEKLFRNFFSRCWCSSPTTIIKEEIM